MSSRSKSHAGLQRIGRREADLHPFRPSRGDQRLRRGAVVWPANFFLIRGMNGVEQMALFAAANSFRSLVLFLPQLVNRVTTTSC